MIKVSGGDFVRSPFMYVATGKLSSCEVKRNDTKRSWEDLVFIVFN